MMAFQPVAIDVKQYPGDLYFPEATVHEPTDRSPRDEHQAQLSEDTRRWQLSDGVLLGVLSSLLLWSLILAGVHATLT
ncbi:MAG TPA: hypothetical protein VFZ01_02190 [Geminicoccaceae bacterium]